MQLPIDIILEKVRDEYKLHEKAQNGYVYMELCKDMYGLSQAGILANKLLTERLATKGYKPCHHTPGLWKHDWRPVWFSLAVDDFGIKYVGEEHAQHLLQTLRHWYEVMED
eukprot:13090733-Ditylum_brightwellii.AAC.1